MVYKVLILPLLILKTIVSPAKVYVVSLSEQVLSSTLPGNRNQGVGPNIRDLTVGGGVPPVFTRVYVQHNRVYLQHNSSMIVLEFSQLTYAPLSAISAR